MTPLSRVLSMLILALALISQGAVARVPMMPKGESIQAMVAMDCYSQIAESLHQGLVMSDDEGCCCDGDEMADTLAMNCDNGCGQCQDSFHYSSTPATSLQIGRAPQHEEPPAYLCDFDSIYLESDERPPIV